MGVERLQLLVRFCNVCGLLPFRMVLDEPTRRFKRFDGHWRHPANWWFALHLMGQIFLTLQIVYMIWSSNTESNKSTNLSSVYFVVFLLFILNFVILLWCPRIFLSRRRHLEVAIELIHRIDGTLTKILQEMPCTTRRRTLVGISISFLAFFIINMIYISIIDNVIPQIGVLGSVLHILFLNCTTLQLISWFIVFHLSFYSLSHRISVLASLINSPTPQEQNKTAVFKFRLEHGSLPVMPSSSLTKRIRTCGSLFDQICKVAHELNHTFSLSVLVILMILMIFCSTSLYFSLYASNNLYEGMFYGFVLFFVFSICVAYAILSSTDLPITEMRRFREQVMKISAADHLGIEELVETTALMKAISAKRIELRAGDLFAVGKHLIPPWIHAVITYFVVFIQSIGDDWKNG